jgi:imidazolonepropionase-like amidohydrolase
MMQLGIAQLKLTTDEAFKAVTRNAALSLGRENLGIIDVNADADLLVWNGI